ncbi:murein DD-endopeptidase MepM/ murein hydrolase activator NlpD [Pedobacter sp. CG_S7]|uniref:peptidoglycan DD-metalloendopeptidase family protein n=1 Tax=Pedobacter sp. CG_S7 TaxID=3143930 RepID=UPI00339B4D02
MSPSQKFEEYFLRKDIKVAKVVDFDLDKDLLYSFDLTSNNKELSDSILSDTAMFSSWVAQKLNTNHCKYGIGGYNEHRTIYSRSSHFDTLEEPRRLHLGVDIWGEAGTPVYNFLPATVQSFKFNDHYGDYGATIILKYQLNDLELYALYGHLSLASLKDLKVGQAIDGGQQFATFGVPEENGHWPPHLHFQLIFDMKGQKGDYPGVCQYTQKERFLSNSPNPAAILKYTFPLLSV